MYYISHKIFVFVYLNLSVNWIFLFAVCWLSRKPYGHIENWKCTSLLTKVQFSSSKVSCELNQLPIEMENEKWRRHTKKCNQSNVGFLSVYRHHHSKWNYLISSQSWWCLWSRKKGHFGRSKNTWARQLMLCPGQMFSFNWQTINLFFGQSAKTLP